MDNFIIGIVRCVFNEYHFDSTISKYLRTYIVGFRRDQIGVNFFGGDAVLHDLEVNCSAINGQRNL